MKIEDVIRSGRFAMLTLPSGCVAIPLTEAGELVEVGDVVKSTMPPEQTHDAIVKLARLMLKAVGNTSPTEEQAEVERVRVHSSFILGFIEGRGPGAGASATELQSAYDRRHRAIYSATAADIATAKMLGAFAVGLPKR